MHTCICRRTSCTLSLVLQPPRDQASFLRLWHYERILVEIVVFERGWVTLSANFREMERRPPTTVGIRKLESMRYSVVCDILPLAVLTHYRRVTDGRRDGQMDEQTDRRTDTR